jgi:hypothetical protein
LREPLVQFLVAGALLFAAYQALSPSVRQGVGTDAHTIELTDADLRQLSVGWLAQGRPAPTPDEMQALVEARVREEVLYREALALGLDRDDTIVKRRLAQKMDFLAEDLSELRQPTTADLAAFLEQHPERFSEPPRVSFRHLYFSPDRRSARAREVAERARTALIGKGADGGDSLGDRFMFQDYYAERAPEQLAKDFGPAFANSLFALAPGSWQGPIESGFGWHLVFVESLSAARAPALEEIEPEVEKAWVEAERRKVREQLYAEMRSRYQVIVPGAPVAPQ